MHKILFTLGIFICSLQLYGQNINGKYLYKKNIKNPDFNFVVFQMIISNDTVYKFNEFAGNKSDFTSYESWNTSVKNGKLKHIKGLNYLLTNWNSGNKKTAVEVKITQKKIIFYTYDIRNIKIKSFEMEKINI